MQQRAKRSRRPQPKLVGYSLPLKTVLRVYRDALDPIIDKALKARGRTLMRKVLGTNDPDWMTLKNAYFEGKMHKDGLKNPHEYFEELAYHIMIKEPSFEAARKHGIFITEHPFTTSHEGKRLLDEPTELLVTEESEGERNVDAFLDEMDEFYRRRFGIGITRPHEITVNPGGIAPLFRVNDARQHIPYPDNWRKNLELQRPPRGDSIKKKREYFNRLYRLSPEKDRDLVGSLVNAPNVKEEQMEGITSVMVDYPSTLIHHARADVI